MAILCGRAATSIRPALVGMKAMLEPLDAVDEAFGLENVHPVIRRHPETWMQVVVRQWLASHGGSTRCRWRRADRCSNTSSATPPDLISRCVDSWTAGDIVMWDNRCVMHYAVHDYDDARPCEMHRVTVRGERPSRWTTVEPRPAASLDEDMDPDRAIVEMFFTERGIADPNPYYHHLRRVAPVHESGTGATFLSRFDHCQRVLRDNRFGSRAAARVVG